MLNSQLWSAIAILSGIAAVAMGAILCFGGPTAEAVKVPEILTLGFCWVWMFLEPT